MSCNNLAILFPQFLLIDVIDFVPECSFKSTFDFPIGSDLNKR